jgi:hypothetical protein
MYGKVDLSNVFTQPAPAPLQHLFRHPDDLVAKHFRQHIRAYNAALAMASSGIQVQQQQAPRMLRIHGRVYHRIGSLLPASQQPAQFAQLYIIDNAEDMLQQRMAAMHAHTPAHASTATALRPDLLRQLQACLLQHNHYVHEFRSVAQAAQDSNQDFTIVLRPHGERDTRYRPAHSSELAGLLINPGEERDILVDSAVRHTLLQPLPQQHCRLICAA